MQFSELDLIYKKFRALNLLSFPGDHQFSGMYFRKFPFFRYTISYPGNYPQTLPRKSQTLPDIIKLYRFVTTFGKQPVALRYYVSIQANKPHRWSRYSPCTSYRRTALQACRSWIQFPMLSCIFFIDFILLAALLKSASKRNECQDISWG